MNLKMSVLNDIELPNRIAIILLCFSFGIGDLITTLLCYEKYGLSYESNIVLQYLHMNDLTFFAFLICSKAIVIGLIIYVYLIAKKYCFYYSSYALLLGLIAYGIIIVLSNMMFYYTMNSIAILNVYGINIISISIIILVICSLVLDLANYYDSKKKL